MARTDIPSMDQWLKEAKAEPNAPENGMYLFHNGIVRQTAKAKVRGGDENAPEVTGLFFDYDAAKVEAAIEDAKKMDGIQFVRVWLNQGELNVGDDIMYVMIGGDIRPRVIDCLQTLVGYIKNECVIEKESY